MPDKLTDKEIVKAKELIKMLQEAYNAYYDTSKGMPYNIDETLRESAFCLENCLNEINRLQERVDDLERNDLPRCKDALRRANEMGIELQAENERLKTECGNQSALWSKHFESIFETAKETIKAEAYKEFAERLKEIAVNVGSVTMEIEADNLLKELAGD